MSIIGALIALIIALILIGVAFWAAKKLIALIPLPEPFGTLVYVLLVLIGVLVVIWVLLTLLGYAGVNVPMFHGLK
jgi:hypothetical protein